MIDLTMDNFVVEKENTESSDTNVVMNEATETLNNPKSEASSLQNSFAKFRERRIKEMQLQKASRVPPAQRTAEFKDNLRAKFVSECKKYIGTPYAERYKKPEDPISPLYLDCCALVRIAVQNLQEDFGFVIGKWNQCYMLDTSPVEIPLEEAKPGDLIFYYGTYTSKRSKKQKHDCVHVEVFLGGETGRSTVGSRYLRGKVGIFDDFEFHSTTWSCDKIVFRSLDTWLGGECRSHCKEHAWEIPDWKLSKNSIFDTGEGQSQGHAAGTSNQESDDEGAGDEEQEEQDQEQGREAIEATNSTGTGTPLTATTATASVSTDGSPAPGEASSTATVTATAVTSTTSSTMAAIAGIGAAAAPKKKAPRVRDPTLSGTSASSSGTSVASSVEKKGSSSTVNPKGYSYYVSNRNGYKLVKAALDKLHWQQIPFEYKFSQRFTLKWVENRSEIDYKAHTPGQLVCHIPNSQCITCKTGLVNTLRTHVVSKKLLAEMSEKPKPLYSPIKSAGSARGKLGGGGGGGESSLVSPVESTTAAAVKEGGKTTASASQPAPVEAVLSGSLRSGDTLTMAMGTTKSPSRANESPIRSGGRSTAGASVSAADGSPMRKSTDWAKGVSLDAIAAVTDTQHVVVPWLPDTFLLESPADIDALMAAENARIASNPKGEGCIWIYKPSANNRGRGIKVVKGMEALKELCYGIVTDDPETTIPPARGIVQQYLENPLLLPGPSPELMGKAIATAEAAAQAAAADAVAIAAEYGKTPDEVTLPAPLPIPEPIVPGGKHKFDLRCYLLIARTEPGFLAYYHPGYCRLALVPYSADPSTLQDNTMHLTNAAIQKKGPGYATLKNYQVQTVDKVIASLEANPETRHNAEYMRTQLDHEIKKCLVDVMRAAVPTLAKKRGYFDLLGCDFMITQDNQLRLLEINTNPALSLDGCDALIEVLPNLVENSINLVLACQGPDRPSNSYKDPTRADKNSELMNNLPGKFCLLYNENTKFEYE